MLQLCFDVKLTASCKSYFIYKYFRVARGSAAGWTNSTCDTLITKYSDEKDVHLLTTVHPHTKIQVRDKNKPITATWVVLIRLIR